MSSNLRFLFLSSEKFICLHQSIFGFSSAWLDEAKLASFLQLWACGKRHKARCEKKAFSGDCFRHKFSAVLLSHTRPQKSGFSQFSLSVVFLQISSFFVFGRDRAGAKRHKSLFSEDSRANKLRA
jgi:hypothetical protein